MSGSSLNTASRESKEHGIFPHPENRNQLLILFPKKGHYIYIAPLGSEANGLLKAFTIWDSGDSIRLMEELWRGEGPGCRWRRGGSGSNVLCIIDD